MPFIMERSRPQPMVSNSWPASTGSPALTAMLMTLPPRRAIIVGDHLHRFQRHQFIALVDHLADVDMHRLHYAAQRRDFIARPGGAWGRPGGNRRGGNWRGRGAQTRRRRILIDILGVGGNVLDGDDIRLAFDGDTEFLLHG
jgi:hypothetical protein